MKHLENLILLRGYSKQPCFDTVIHEWPLDMDADNQFAHRVWYFHLHQIWLLWVKWGENITAETKGDNQK